MKKISYKILAGYLFVVLLLGIVAYLGITGMKKEVNTFAGMMEKRLSLAKDIEGLRYTMLNQGYCFRGYFITNSEKWFQKFLQEGEKARKLAVTIRPRLQTENDRAALAKIVELQKKYEDICAQVKGLMVAGRAVEAVPLTAAAGKVFNELDVVSNEFLALNDQAGKNDIARTIQDAQFRQQEVMAVSLVAGLIAVLIIIFLNRSISKPVIGLAESLARVAEGDLTVSELKVTTKDEIGTMTKAFNSMLESLKNVLHQINTASQSVASTSRQLSSNSNEASKATEQVAGAIEEVAKGSGEQSRSVGETVEVMIQVARSIEQIASGAQEQSKNVINTIEIVDEMVNRVDEMAKGMQKVREVSEQSKAIAENGGQAVERTVTGMFKVKESTSDTAGKINQLGEQSQKIGEIIQVIDDIAEQTNLLALNAAIEAARAGEHGKGFAVVADEVRKLAERSSKATKEIAELITGMQHGTEAAVASMQVGATEVEEGVNLAKEAGGALREILRGVQTSSEHVNLVMNLIEKILNGSQEVSRAVNNVAAITEENTAATEQMSASAQQVSSSMLNVASISEENASAAEEVSASTQELTASIEEISSSSEQLSQMARELQNLVAKFRL